MPRTGDTSGTSFRKVFTAATISTAVIILTALAAVWLVQERDLRHETDLRIYFLRHHLKDEVKDEAELMEGLLDLIVEKKPLRDAWLARDRSRLLAEAAPVLAQLRSRYGITHFYFLDTDRTCFLRVHNPAVFGDSINRLTLEHASASGKNCWGQELGPFGRFMVRVVHPVRVDGKVIGFMELGEEVGEIFDKITRLVSADFILAVEKKNLDRKQWEEGLAMSGKTGDWGLYKNVVVTATTLPGVGKDEERYLERGTDLTGFSLVHDRKCFQGGYDHLVDVGGNPVGRYVILCDVTDRRSENFLVLTVVAAVCTAAGAGILLPLYRRREHFR